MADKAPATNKPKTKQWYEKISRSAYFFAAVLLHLIVFVMVSTFVIFPAFHPPQDDFEKTYVPTSSPPPPPPQQTVQVPTQAASAPATITTPSSTATFTVPLPDINPSTTPINIDHPVTEKVVSAPNTISEARLSKIMDTEKSWNRDRQNILESNSDPKNITAKFPVYLASYANGDWGCNTEIADGKIVAGSMANFVVKMNEWSHGHITGTLIPTPLDIGGPELLDKKPPFIFFTGHKDFVLSDQEIQNLRDYLQIGGAIWGDNALAGRGSRFDVAFRREMKRVVPDKDKNFVPVPLTGDVYTKSWFNITKVPEGMNYYAEPIEELDIDGKLAILYTPNDYSDMLSMHILPGDTSMGAAEVENDPMKPLHSWGTFVYNGGIYFRNYSVPSCVACNQLGMNIIGFLLVRFDKDLLLTP